MKHLLKGFKKVAEDESSTTFEHPNGHTMKVAKNALSPEFKKKLSDLPHYDSGGFIGDTDRMRKEKSKSQDSSAPVLSRPGHKIPYGYKDGGTVGLHDDYSSDAKKFAVAETFRKTFHKGESDEDRERRKVVRPPGGALPSEPLSLPAGFADGATPDQTEELLYSPISQSKEATSEDIAGLLAPQSVDSIGKPWGQAPSVGDLPTPNSEQAPDPAVYGTPAVPAQPAAPTAPSVDAMALADQGYMQEANAIGQEGRAREKAAQDQQKAMQMLQDNWQKELQSYDNERLSAYNDLKNGHIEPKHYLQSMSGFDKAMTAIGMILSGIGSGMTGGPNLAMQYIEKQIDRDIEAQKAEMDKKQNLLSHLEKQFGNKKDATIMGKAMLSDMYATKLEEVAAKSKDPMAQARAKQAMAEWHAKYSAPLQEVAQRQAVMKAMQSGAKVPLEIQMQLVPEKDRAKAVEEAQKVELSEKAKDMADRTIDEAFKLNSFVNRGMHPFSAKSRLNTLETNLLAPLKEVFNNFSESDKAQALSYMPTITDDAADKEFKKEQFRNFIDSRVSFPTLKMHGIQPQIKKRPSNQIR